MYIDADTKIQIQRDTPKDTFLKLQRQVGGSSRMLSYSSTIYMNFIAYQVMRSAI